MIRLLLINELLFACCSWMPLQRWKYIYKIVQETPMDPREWLHVSTFAFKHILKPVFVRCPLGSKLFRSNFHFHAPLISVLLFLLFHLLPVFILYPHYFVKHSAHSVIFSMGFIFPPPHVSHESFRTRIWSVFSVVTHRKHVNIVMPFL